MLFQDIIGQQSVKDHLVQIVQQNRLSHALLFLGKEGSGALSLALAFSQFIVCTDAAHQNSQKSSADLFGLTKDLSTERPQTGNESCGVCPACLKASKLIHPDIHYTYPVITQKNGDKSVSTDFIVEWRKFILGYPYGNIYDWLQFIGAENKQGNITSEECKDINRKLSLKGFESKYKILVMWMPEFLGKEGNKLLKLIEEPPPDTLFIFVAEDEHAILPTILSRTQLVKIPALKDNEIEKALISRGNENELKAQQIAAVAEGNYREALKLLQHADEDWQLLLREWLNAIIKTGPGAQVKWIDEISKLGREKQKQFIRYFIHLLEQAIRIRLINTNSFSPAINDKERLHATSLYINIPEKEKDFALRLNKMCSLSAQQAIVNELDKATWYIERNANGKMLFHALSIRLKHIIKDNSLILIH